MVSSVNQPLPTSAELPCSDDTPADNEDQNLLPNLLLLLLTEIWSDRLDWYFGADMAIYHTTGISHAVPVVPDGFLSVGVERKKGGKSRRSYVMWEEQDIPPIFILEMVSHTPGDEYTKKLEIYARLGVRYYLIYNPEFWLRDRHRPFEVYKLEEGTYRLQIGEPYWMPEAGLGIGRYQGIIGGIEQEILTWYEAKGNRHLSKAEKEEQRAELERKRADQEQRARERLEAYLRSQGIDPSQLPE
ncbi:MAG: Uma2 family endonuclease [Cyanophyceae cyanobacterium]